MNQPHKSLKGLVMTTPPTKTARTAKQLRRAGMTMIELLVAISILVIIAAILVPQLRLASADRNIREASRMVASLFAQASQRGINDGVAGVVIERNPNIIDEATGFPVAYAGTSMFILRQVPKYTGEQEGDEAEYAQTSPFRKDPNHDPFNPDDDFGLFFDVWIPLPIEQEELQIVGVGDRISFNNLPFQFLIESTKEEPTVSGEPGLRLRVQSPINSVAPNLPTEIVPLDANDEDSLKRVVIGSFIIHRQPRKLVSSRIDLPAGYLVDLRLSGELARAGDTHFTLDNRDPNAPDALLDPDTGALVPNSIAYTFNGRGSIDHIVYTDAENMMTAGMSRQAQIPKQTAYLLVREYSTDDGGELIQNVLNSERQMWVTVDPVTGAANVVPGVPVDLGGAELSSAALQEARKLGSQGQAAQ